MEVAELGLLVEVVELEVRLLVEVVAAQEDLHQMKVEEVAHPGRKVLRLMTTMRKTRVTLEVNHFLSLALEELVEPFLEVKVKHHLQHQVAMFGSLLAEVGVVILTLMIVGPWHHAPEDLVSLVWVKLLMEEEVGVPD